MKNLALAAGLALGLGGGWAQAQEVRTGEEPGADEATPEAGAEEKEAARPRHRIRVLDHPYDIASYYRSRQGYGLFGYDPRSERYPIAGYYRSRQVAPPYYGYGAGEGGPGFWRSGYSDARGPGGLTVGYHRSIGENGDLFLFAPTFLAPLGPLTGFVLFGR